MGKSTPIGSPTWIYYRYFKPKTTFTTFSPQNSAFFMCSTVATALTPTWLDCEQVTHPVSFLYKTSAQNSVDNIVVVQYMLWNYC